MSSFPKKEILINVENIIDSTTDKIYEKYSKKNQSIVVKTERVIKSTVTEKQQASATLSENVNNSEKTNFEAPSSFSETTVTHFDRVLDQFVRRKDDNAVNLNIKNLTIEDIKQKFPDRFTKNMTFDYDFDDDITKSENRKHILEYYNMLVYTNNFIILVYFKNKRNPFCAFLIKKPLLQIRLSSIRSSVRPSVHLSQP
jgi:hypothetical protein